MPPRIATFGSLRDDENKEDDANKPNEYYSGGRESGVAVQGRPDAAGPNPNAGSLFEQFQNSLAAQSEPTPQELDAQNKPKPIKLTLWSGGTFSIDDDESEVVQRNPATDPAAARLIDDVKRGVVPEELRRKYGNEVDLSIENRSQDAFEVKPRPMKAFSGSGRRLGDVVPNVAGVESAAPAAASAAAPAAAPVEPVIDDSQPVTKVQIRLGDGTRLAAKFNKSSTLADLRHFVNASRPGEPRAFAFMTTRPKVVFEDESLTLEAAGLCGAVVNQKFI